MVPWPSGVGRVATPGPNPPSKDTNGSSVPWKVAMGTGRAGSQPSMTWMPATGAPAAMRSAWSHSMTEVMNAPLDRPVT